MPFKWPANFTTVPLLERVEGSTCYFIDGTSKRIDAIMLCTGYRYDFPFLPDELRLHTTNRMWCDELYNGIFLETNPKIMYLGMQNQHYTFKMFAAQAWYARDVMMGKIQLPDAKGQKEHFDKWRAREGTLKSFKSVITFQGDYIKELIEATDYPKFDIAATNREFLE
jgi:trimethylamine monooxygenase